MGQEIERKFLVKGDFKNQASKSFKIVQGYISSVPERTVRVRIIGDQGFLTIKGIGNESGTSRYEWEQQIDVKDAHDLLLICEPGVIDKTRYIIETGHHIYEVDEFHADNEGLLIAEIELESADEDFERAEWLGEEITGDVRYYNSMLMKEPYTFWKNQ